MFSTLFKTLILTVGLVLVCNQDYPTVISYSKSDLARWPDKELLCLATAIWYESRSESLKAQTGVGQVVMNRSKHKSYPKSICEVVKQRRQFAWYKGTKLNHKRFIGDLSGLNHQDTLAYHQAKIIASRLVLINPRPIPELNNSLYFLTKGYQTNWSIKLKKKASIDNIEFY